MSSFRPCTSWKNSPFLGLQILNMTRNKVDFCICPFSICNISQIMEIYVLYLLLQALVVLINYLNVVRFMISSYHFCRVFGGLLGMFGHLKIFYSIQAKRSRYKLNGLWLFEWLANKKYPMFCYITHLGGTRIKPYHSLFLCEILYTATYLITKRNST